MSSIPQYYYQTQDNINCMSDSIQIETINSYTKNTTKEIGKFPIATGAITNCPVPVNSVSSVSVFSPPPLILEPLNVPPIIPTPQILGCTDPSAINYNPIATANDGSCVYPVLGCTDPNATNYNPSANINDGSCIYLVPFCMALYVFPSVTVSQTVIVTVGDVSQTVILEPSSFSPLSLRFMYSEVLSFSKSAENATPIIISVNGVECANTTISPTASQQVWFIDTQAVNKSSFFELPTISGPLFHFNNSSDQDIFVHFTPHGGPNDGTTYVDSLQPHQHDDFTPGVGTTSVFIQIFDGSNNLVISNNEPATGQVWGYEINNPLGTYYMAGEHISPKDLC